MGQYYIAYMSKGNHKKSYKICSHEYDSGIKLCEHSWINNPMMDAVTTFLYNNPHRVAWVGDYTDELKTSPNEDLKFNDMLSIYSKAWGRGVCNLLPKAFVISYNKLYLINKTKKLYVSFKDYMKDCATNDGWCLHPLSILTAIGNGLGGGDYYGCNREMVGIWAYDRIYVSDKYPKSYKPFNPVFINL